MKKSLYLAVFFLLFVTANTFACRYSRPSLNHLNSSKAVMQLSKDNQSLLKMIPSKWGHGKDKYSFVKLREAYAIAFKLTENGQLKYLWSAKGIYPRSISNRRSFDIYFSNDGQKVVKIDHRPAVIITDKGKVNPTKQSAIKVYNNGKIIREYFLNILVSERFMKARRDSCGGVDWLKSMQIDRDMLYLQTKEGKKLMINLTNGGLSRKK